MKPVRDEIFIEVDWHPEKIGMIFTPPSMVYKRIPRTGVVKAKSPRASTEFEVGDRVLYDSHHADITHIKNEQGYALSRVSSKHVLAVINGIPDPDL